ncbi:MAG: hypothetical protein JXA11_04740 [Phycisphaerae bacterium]|nr:hypothetical protein [Phycisphaerae bacterium]
MAAIALILGGISAAAVFFANVAIQNFTRRYEEHNAQRILRILTDDECHDWQTLMDTPITVQKVMQYVVPRARYTAFAMRSLLDAILPIFTFIFALGCMIYVNAFLSVALIPLTLIYLFLLFRINSYIAHCHETYRNEAFRLRPRLGHTVTNILESSGPTGKDATWNPKIYESEEFDYMTRCFYGRILAHSRLEFLNSAFFILCISLLFLYFGMGKREGWAELLAFLISLRYTWTSLRRTTSRLTNVSRFLPEFRKYGQFIRDAESLRQTASPRIRGESPLPRVLNVPLQPSASSNSISIPLQKGRVYFLLTAEPIKRFALVNQAMDLMSIAGYRIVPEQISVHADAKYLSWLGPMENALGLPSSQEEQHRLIEGLKILGVYEELQPLLDSERRGDDPESLPAPRAEALYAIVAAHCFVCPQPFTFLKLPNLASRKPDFIERFFDLIPDSILFLVDHDEKTILGNRCEGIRDRIDGVLVIHHDEIRGGDLKWLEANGSLLSARMAAEKAEGGIDESDDEDVDLY